MSVPEEHAPGVADPDPAIPPVVAVVVAHEPGAWFDETLASLAAQSYRNLAVLVVDTGQDGHTRSRIAEHLPDAHYRKVPEGTGFGQACNEVLTAVEGAAFYLLCHDDVRLDPDVVQIMVEEAFRSNAGIVGPKLVEWSEPSHLLSVGMGADKTGYPAPYVERGELDQEQHDAVRDVFSIPGAVTLVRADLFRTLGGFDPGIDFHADDLDLCWRAHVAGARVVVAPGARVAHLEALGARRPLDDRRRLQMRHRLRALKVSSTGWTRFRVVPQAAVLALVEVIYCVVLGRFRQARDVAGAWLWNARRRGETRRQRKALAAVRTLPDSDVRRNQVRGSARMAAFLRGRIGTSDDRLPAVAGASRDLAASLRSSKARTALVAWLIVLGVILVGSRDLVFGRLTAIGDMVSFGSSAFDLVETWVSGYRSVGLGAVAPNPTGLGVFGVLGTVAFGALDLVRKFFVLGLLPVGLGGMWRLCKPLGSRRSRIVALVVYAAVPVPYNALAGGSWSGLALYAAVPWMLSQLARASGLAPYGARGGIAGPGVRPRPLVQRVVALGVITGLTAIVAPSAVLVVVAMALALVLGGLLVGQVAGAVRTLVAGVGAAVVAVVLQLPWSLSFASEDWASVVGAVSGGEGLGVGQILRLETGPLGAGALSYLFLVAAALSLLIGRDWRLGWAVRGWVLVLAGMAAVWVQAQGWVPDASLAPELLLVPTAAGLALATAMGMAAFEVDLPDYHFGLRQVASLLAGVALVLSILPVVGAAFDGRWAMPRGDYDHTLGFFGREGDAGPFRVLWVGDAGSLPLSGWPLDASGIDDLGNGGQLAYATSDDGPPTLDDRWAGPPSPATERLGDVLRVAGDAGTSRLGAFLAPMGIRYIVVPLAPAPAPYLQPTSQPADLLAMLDSQLDLAPVTAAGVVIYQNNAWGPTRAQLPPGTPIPDGGDRQADQLLPQVQGAPVALPDEEGYQRFGGQLEPSEVYLAAQSSEHWQLTADGRDAPRRDALGWANAFEVGQAGSAQLTFRTPVTRYLALAGQVALWVIALVFLLRVRVVRDERRTLPAEVAEAEDLLATREAERAAGSRRARGSGRPSRSRRRRR